MVCLGSASLASQAVAAGDTEAALQHRLRVVIETDAGGDPDDEQSLVRFLLYANEWDVEGIIANRPVARARENLNPERTGLGIVRAQLKAYAAVYPRLIQHDPRYPSPEQLYRRTVAGYDNVDDGLALILAAVDSPDPRPVWFCNWGTDHGSAVSNLKRALDRVLRERGQDGYARFKQRLRLSSADAFGDHTSRLNPPWSLWVDTFRPELAGQRWYHRFSALTAQAGGFDVERDLLTNHGPLGALYPTNTTHRQKEGDTMTFLYLVPTGMNDVNHPDWGSWAGRYGLNGGFPGRRYYWANQADAWQDATNRDNTLARWAADLQNDFRARLDWCVKDFRQANHPPVAVVNGRGGKGIMRISAASAVEERLPDGTNGRRIIELSAAGSSDPDGDPLAFEWWIYPEAGTYRGDEAALEGAHSSKARLRVPADLGSRELHLILTVRDRGAPPLAAYRRVIVSGSRTGD
jgi:Cellulose-binding Sde182, nucleoside hydrolase-like domain/Cellulose-binding protein Sde0182, C-terminal domain